MPYTLIVVDCQRQFTASRKKSLINNCKSLIHSAMNDEADIIFLEYIGFGRTNRTLTDISDAYYRSHFIRKSDCSGANEIKAVKKAFNLQTQHFKICGVNTDQCVQETVIILSELFKSSVIEVIASACNSDSKKHHEQGLEYMAWYDNVIINKKPSL